jgi:hypothetical protein
MVLRGKYRLAFFEDLGHIVEIHVHQSSEAETDSLAAAAREVGRCLCPDGSTSGEEWNSARARETEALINWAEKNGRLIPLSAVQGRARHSGMEHGVWFDEPSGRWFKLTHSGEFGRFPEIDYTLDKQTQNWCQQVLLRVGTPGEYLERMLLSRDLFGDDVNLEGVAKNGDHACVLISQAHIIGKAPRTSEVTVFMRKAGFLPAPDFAWYKPDTGIGAFDAQVRNFLRAGKEIIPIDLILTPTTGELRDFFLKWVC